VTLLIAILTLALAAVVVVLVSAPLRRAGSLREQRQEVVDSRRAAANGSAMATHAERDELEAAREAKYREIRDCELDYRTGKLSRADYEAIDGQLRAEAIAILDRLESISPTDGAA